MKQAVQRETTRTTPHLEPVAIRVAVEDSSVVVVSGELDVATWPELSAALEAATLDGPGTVVVDFSDVTFVDTRCMGVIVAAHEQLRSRSVAP